jgi:hypothetical protein
VRRYTDLSRYAHSTHSSAAALDFSPQDMPTTSMIVIFDMLNQKLAADFRSEIRRNIMQHGREALYL